MAVYTFEISAEHNNYPNLTVYDRFRDGSPLGWKVEANPGYVFYDTTENNTELDENGNEVPVTYYYTLMYISPYFNWANFSLVAVPRDSVDENYIFGDTPGNDHEVM